MGIDYMGPHIGFPSLLLSFILEDVNEPPIRVFRVGGFLLDILPETYLPV